MPTLSERDPQPTGRGRPPLWLIALIAVAAVIVVLHLTGVVGPGG